MGTSLSKLIQEYYVTDECCTIFKIWMFNVQYKLTQSMDPHYIYLIPRQWIHWMQQTPRSPCTCRLSSLGCLTSVHSDHLPSCSLWRRHCSLAIALSSCSRCSLSLALSRFIGVELHGEESSVAFSRSTLVHDVMCHTHTGPWCNVSYSSTVSSWAMTLIIVTLNYI